MSRLALLLMVLCVGCGGAPPPAPEVVERDVRTDPSHSTAHGPGPAVTGKLSPKARAKADPWLSEPIPIEGHEREEPIRGGAFASDAGFRVDPVPPGVRFMRVENQEHVWEVVNGLGERLAIVAARKLAEAEKAPSTQGHVLAIDDWEGHTARIQVERFSRNAWVYYIQRLTEGTDFLHDGWYHERQISVFDPK